MAIHTGTLRQSRYWNYALWLALFTIVAWDDAASHQQPERDTRDDCGEWSGNGTQHPHARGYPSLPGDQDRERHCRDEHGSRCDVSEQRAKRLQEGEVALRERRLASA